jgi:serralysin
MTNNISIAYSCDIENAVGGGGADVISGNALANRLVGGAGNDAIYALSGNDIVIGGVGDDLVDGGDGSDYVYLEDSWSALSWAFDQTSGYLTISGSLSGKDLVKNVEYFRDKDNVVKSFADLTGIAPPAYSGSVSVAANALSVAEGTGASSIYRFTVTLSNASTEVETVAWNLSFGSGSGQADALDFSGPLSGTASFAAGQTTAFVDVTIAGDSTFESDEAFSLVLSNPSSGVLLGAASASGIIVNDDAEPTITVITGDDGSLTVIGTTGDDTLIGGAGDDTLRGTTGNDTLYGWAGNDLLFGGAGVDKLYGGVGDDTYMVDNVGDKIIEYVGEGIDTIRTSLASYTLPANVERLEYTGTGAFSGTGNALANTIIGGAGNDMLNGGAGSDVLVGGDGADRFVFNTALGAANIDFIDDFNSGMDKIVLENAIFKALKKPGDLSAGAFNTGTAATQADDRIIYDPNSGAVFYDSDGTGSAAAIHFATLDAGLSLTQFNFQVI